MSVDGPGSGMTEPVGDVLESQTPTRRRGFRRGRLVAGAVALAVLGLGLAGGGYVASIPTPELPELPSSTTVYYNDGTVLARLGSVDRTPLASTEIATTIQQVAVAAEDPGFWTSRTGEISRSVVRTGMDISSTTMASRARIAVQAWKLDGQRSKEEILEYYLNAIPFGRNVYGIEAAAREYFDKTARADAPAEQRLTTAEAMVLLAIVRQPYPDPDDPAGSPGYDPAAGQIAAANSQRRWAEIRDSMVALSYLSAADAAALTYPSTVRPFTGPAADNGFGTPAGLVVNHVLDELTHTDLSPFKGRTWESIASGGYSITTTLDPRAQHALERTADGAVSGSVMSGEPSNLQTAGVVVEPATGRVLAYFGGHDGRGSDYASFYFDENSEATGVGRHPPGSSFMAYTLAAALKANFSLQSRWQWTPHQQDGRGAANPVRNKGECVSDRTSMTGTCSLLEATTSSLYVPLYDVTLGVTPFKVLELARDVGIDYMWNDSRERQDLRPPSDLTRVVGPQFDIVLGIGQYPVTVLDQANAMATFAAGGLRADAHFVRQVTKGAEVLYREVLPAPDQARVLTAAQSADLTYALSQGTGSNTLAMKTGDWEFNPSADQNAHAWSVGYSSTLAMAVWIGNKADEQAIIDRQGNPIGGAGLPSTILRTVMTDAQRELGLNPSPFPPPAFGGRLDPPLSVPA
jgi:membrane peptidoglycan carboxypeptidase